jgi:hypothetical protein
LKKQNDLQSNKCEDKSDNCINYVIKDVTRESAHLVVNDKYPQE